MTSTSELRDLVDRAVRRFISVRRLDRDWVMATAELRLYAAREPEIREAYLALRQETQRQLLEGAEAMAEVSGWEFAVPRDSVMEILDNMYEGAVLQALLLYPDRGDEERVQACLQPFIDVMVSIVRPLGSRV
ncbi:hypothetical protein [Raineyella fluvialis]|uniref:TetR family transcriptional regulator n=1 Tax=Raineyella fluvialis TaxID=2662261 RepID=A0A5Q2FBY0_9ACTN|nr:hypothetical protein [Raineyella fluvialis]QGF23227.1 hypothetical protein Rai3103_05625 [Raineyella fluvialis]